MKWALQDHNTVRQRLECKTGMQDWHAVHLECGGLTLQVLVGIKVDRHLLQYTSRLTYPIRLPMQVVFMKQMIALLAQPPLWLKAPLRHGTYFLPVDKGRTPTKNLPKLFDQCEHCTKHSFMSKQSEITCNRQSANCAHSCPHSQLEKVIHC